MAKFAGTGLKNQNRIAMERLRAKLDGVSEEAMHRADQRAQSSVRRRFEAVAKRQVRATYNVQLKELAGAYRLASGQDGRGEFVELMGSTKSLPLLAFLGRWRGPARRRGGGFAPAASAAILRGRGRKVYDSAFIATIHDREEIVARQFSRDSRLASGRDPRNKIRSLRGPSPFQMVIGLGSDNAAAISDQISEYRLSEVKRQLRLARGRRG